MDAECNPALNKLSSGAAAAQAEIAPALRLPWMIGFYFSFRTILVVIAVRLMGQDPQFGAALNLALNFALLGVVAFHSLGDAKRPVSSLLRPLPCRMALAFLALSGVSLLWSATDSIAAAVAFWCAMAADFAMVALLLNSGEKDHVSGALIHGYVLGACCVAATGWMLPTQSDLRLGDEELLGANAFGYVCAMGIFLGQYALRLERTQRRWSLSLAFLAVTLLRTLSKTTILAFLAGQAFVLLRDRSIPRKTKYLVTAAAAVVVAAAWGLLESYFDVYSNAGNQAETLSGRIGIWAIMLDHALEQPWLGHGFHSVWKVIPPFGPDAFEIRHAHNELLQQFYAYGVLGVLLVVCLYFSLFLSIRRLPRSSVKTLLSGLLIFVLVRGVADTEVFDLSLPLWAVALFCAGMEQLAPQAATHIQPSENR